MRRSQARAAQPPAAYRKSVPCPLCGGGTGRCRVCRGERRVTVYLPLRRLDDEELRRHAQRLFDNARGISGGACVWLFGARRRVVGALGIQLSRALSHALGCFDPARVRVGALAAAREAGKIGSTDAVRALCEVARRARWGAYGPPPVVEELTIAEFVDEIAHLPACDSDEL